MKRYDTFVFDSYSINDARKTISFRYQLHGDKKLIFTEELELARPIDPAIDENLLQTCIFNLHLIIGIGYYKAFCPPVIEIKTGSLTPSQATFWNTIYTKGLGEFYYRNQIDYRDLIHFPAAHISVLPHHLNPQDRALVGMGGGKDSIVTAEILKKNAYSFEGFITSYTDVPLFMQRMMSIIGVTSHIVKRRIDPQLLDLNKKGETMNGHVPVSVIYAFIGLLLAVLYDFKYIIVSNEQSSNVGNVDYLGETVNHQWSKSWEFERIFNQYIKDTITPDVTYFSLLRPFSELKIAQLFSQYPQYFSTFTSCNRNFRLQGSGISGLWCGECSKCAFVFLVLAAWLDRKTIVAIFQKDLFLDEQLLPLYRALAGIAAIKPFDCVGTFEEVREAFRMVCDKKEFEDTPVMQMYKQEIAPKYGSEKYIGTLDYTTMPEKFRKFIS